MIDIAQELKYFRKENKGLNKRINLCMIEIDQKNYEIKELKENLKISENSVQPIRESLNRMTAEHGKNLKKLKRLGVEL